MTKHEQYGLIFYKQNHLDRIIPLAVQQVDYSSNSALQFISRLSKHEIESLIYDLERCLNSQGNIDEGFFSGSVEDIDILYVYPNINIDNVLLISMQDMKIILQEWLVFVNS